MMTTWNELLASIGIGNARLILSLPNAAYRQGEFLNGKLTLQGGEVEQQIDSLTVTLDQTWMQGESSKIEQLDLRIIEHNLLIIVPHESVTYPFQLWLPPRARMSVDNVTTRVHAIADIVWAVNPRACLDIRVTLQCELQAVLNALGLLGFTETSVYFEFSLLPISHAFKKYYRAPESLRDQFDGLSLHADPGEAGVMGSLIVNRREHNLTERFRAMVGGDREEFPLIIPHNRLRTPEGEPNGWAALPYITDILEKAKIAPRSEKDWLLRASSAPDDAHDILLRPAEGQPDTTLPDELLRPSEKQKG